MADWPVLIRFKDATEKQNFLTFENVILESGTASNMNTVRYATKKTKLILSVCPACHETHIYRKWNTERDDTLDHIEYAKTKTESSRNDNDALNSHTYIANTMNSQVHPVEDERWRFFKYLPQWWRNRFRWEFVGCCNWRLGGRWVGVGIVRRWVDAVIEGGICRDGILW